MNMKKHWLKSLAVAAVVAMGSANASAEVLAAVAANGRHGLHDAQAPIAGMSTKTFKHSGGPLVATYSAECSVSAPETSAYGDKGVVDVDITVSNEQGTQVLGRFAPTGDDSAFCSSNVPGKSSAPGTYSITAVSTLPPGVYTVEVRGRTNSRFVSGWMGPRSLVVSR